jgi:hypothetical protein
MTRRLFVVLGLGLGFAGCGGSDPLEVPEQCNPLGAGASCMMPWPSSAYLAVDSATETGFHLDVPIEAMPINNDQIYVDPAPINRWDGFSPSGPILASFPAGVSADGLPPLDHPEESLEADSPIVLVNMETGERAPFFAEVDMNQADPLLRTLIIRPVVRLAPGSRYAVGIRTTVKGGDGAALPISNAFAALRDGTDYNHPRMAALTPRYDDIFAALEAEGVSKDDLALAWDFVTASDEFLTRDLMTMRTDALEAMGTAGANLTYTADELAGDPTLVHKLLIGTVQSPNFLTNGERDDSVMRRAASGLPEMDGMRDANFAAIIPKCVVDVNTVLPVPVMVFGHGLFGSAKEYLSDDFVGKLAEQDCFVIIAGDFIGLTSRQLGTAAIAANDLNKANAITEKLAQSVIDFISIEHAIRGPMHDNAQFEYNGVPVVDPTRVFYFGASLGGIMGTVFMGYDPTITRGALGVPGGPWSMLVERSNAWNALQAPAHSAYVDQSYYQILVSLLTMAFEPYDPITSAPHVINDPMPDTPAKQIFMYETLGDCLVSNISSETLARTMGLPVVMPSLKQPYGLAPLAGTGSSGFSIYDEHPTPLPSEFNTPPVEDNGTHSGVHQRAAVLRQIEAFLYDGVVSDQCFSDGVTAVECDCSTGACE